MALPLQELSSWLALMRTPQLGAARIRTLVTAHGTAAAALAARGTAWRELGIDPGVADATTSKDLARGVDSDLAWLQRRECALLRFNDDDWPELLERIADPPAALFVQGRANCLWQPQIAIVGSRQATRGGIELAREFAAGLVARGLTVTSGLARGIDQTAHAAALDAGGLTVAACGTGLDVEYPRGSGALAAAIAERGMLISEHGTGAAPLAAHFPRRNRLISGLSLGTLVIEAGLQSGSLITARLASEQGREVFAVPGSIRNPLARGCHALIRDGARLVESVEEICDALVPMAAELARAIRERLGGETPDISLCQRPVPTPCRHEQSSRADAEALPDAVLEAVGFDPVALETLYGAVQLDTAAVSARLITLELAGFIEALPGARYVRLR